jgi:DNA-binding response OmpR family regulator
MRPFAAEELRARVRALLRRNGGAALRRLVVDDLTLDPMTRQASRGGRRLDLTDKEFRLLEYLMRHSGRPVPREIIGEQVWGAEWDGLTNVIDVFVCRLRKKVEPDGAPRLLHPVRGVGYLVASDAD